MKLKVIKGPIQKNIIVPTSKSWANRYLILAAISKKVVKIHFCPKSSDVENLISALMKVGLDIEREGTSVIVKNSFPDCESRIEGDTIELLTGDGGTTNRFLFPLLTRGKKDYIIKTSPEFMKRPKKELVDIFKKYGFKIEEGRDYWLKVFGGGKFNSNNIDVDCRKSTQFISGPMLAYADEDIQFNPLHLQSSESYYEMTKRSVEEFRQGVVDFMAPVDFSSLSYPLVFSVGENEVNFLNCFKVDPLQADSFLISFLKQKGVTFNFNDNGLSIDATQFDYKPFELSCGNFPDLVPSLVFLMCLCEGKSKLMDLEVLTYKESDRFREIIKILTISGIKFITDEDSFSLSVHGPVKHEIDSVLELPPDHRMVMLAAMLLKKFGHGEVDQVEHVKKSYPEFFSDFNIS